MFVIPMLSCALSVACGGESKSSAAETDPRKNPGYVIDSLFPMDEEIRRFQATISGEPPASLEPRITSRDALAQSFFTALVAADSAKLRQLHISVAEFAYLYFPTSEFAAPPYELKPGFLWFRMTGDSNRGLTKAMRAITNRVVVFAKIDCAAEPERQGSNLIWEKCVLFWRISPGDSLRSARLFGGIIERDGSFKVLSYANGL